MIINSVNYSANTVAEWTPQVAVWTAILAGLSITIFLLLFSRPPFKLPVILPRYSAATGAGLVVWMALLWWKQAIPFYGVEASLELVAGGLIFMTAIFCNYYIGNISAGFRIEMLINLAEARRELTLDEWMALFGKGRGMSFFLEDRLQATLLPWKLAIVRDDKITLTPFGRVVGQINAFLAALFSEGKTI